MSIIILDNYLISFVGKKIYNEAGGELPPVDGGQDKCKNIKTRIIKETK